MIWPHLISKLIYMELLWGKQPIRDRGRGFAQTLKGREELVKRCSNLPPHMSSNLSFYIPQIEVTPQSVNTDICLMLFRSYIAIPSNSWVDDFIDWLNPGSRCCRLYSTVQDMGKFCPASERENLYKQKQLNTHTHTHTKSGFYDKRSSFLSLSFFFLSH